MSIDQIAIFVLGTAGLFLNAVPRNQLRAYGVLLSLTAQPFWFYTTAVHEQWGAFAASFLYTSAWLLSAWFLWVKGYRHHGPQ